MIIHSTFKTEVDLNLKSAMDNNQFLMTIYYSIFNNAALEGPFGNQQYLLKKLQTIGNNGQVFIGTSSEILYFEDSSFALDLKNMEQGSQILDKNGKKYLQVISMLSQEKEKENISEEEAIYFENLVDISKIYELRDKNYQTYCLFLIAISIVSSLVIAVFSAYVTKPLKKLKQTSESIANGNLQERNVIGQMKSPEFVSLARTFNDMADKLENYIEELKDYNKRQDDFIFRFTHELKTPLTSIIGYSELLRTYDIEPKRRYYIADYIYKEGKRLEDLSHHLLQLILLKQDEFCLKANPTQTFFGQLKKTLEVLLKKYKVVLSLEIEDAMILIEPVLLKSLLYNLIDNACKASALNQQIIMKGQMNGGRYQISVTDFGSGIPEESISKVTIPFYMVDKSRARKQGGAGIGLSLCQEIARIHGSTLEIHSQYKKGTTVSFEVEVERK